MNKKFNTTFVRLSETKPDSIRKLMLNAVGEKSKEKLYNNLKDLTDSYPNFEKWFYNTVIPEMELKNGKREVIIAISEFTESKECLITGIAILKKSLSEKKICTFRVHKDFRGNGIGSELFEECFRYLGTRKPMISISENTIDMFKKHIETYKFHEEEVLDGYYKEGIKEHVYNGKLK